HQSKLFSMTLDDPLETCLDSLVVDEARYAQAVERMRSIEVLGLQPHYDQFLADLTERYRWVFKDIDDREVSGDSWKPSASFLARIASDNAADVAFYDEAVVHYEKTHATSAVHSVPRTGRLRSALAAARRRDLSEAGDQLRAVAAESVRSG